MPFGDDNVVSKVHWYVFFSLMPMIFTSNKSVLKIWSNFLKIQEQTNEWIRMKLKIEKTQETFDANDSGWWLFGTFCNQKCHLHLNGSAFWPLKKAFLVPSNKNQQCWNENISWTKRLSHSSENNVLIFFNFSMLN